MFISDLSYHLSEQLAAADVYESAASHAPLKASPLTSGLRAPDGTYLLSVFECSKRGVCC